jgi:hypothetical protein
MDLVVFADDDIRQMMYKRQCQNVVYMWGHDSENIYASKQQIQTWSNDRADTKSNGTTYSKCTVGMKREPRWTISEKRLQHLIDEHSNYKRIILDWDMTITNLGGLPANLFEITECDNLIDDVFGGKGRYEQLHELFRIAADKITILTNQRDGAAIRMLLKLLNFPNVLVISRKEREFERGKKLWVLPKMAWIQRQGYCDTD